MDMTPKAQTTKAKIRNESEDVATALTEIQILRKCYEQLYANN